ncbi:MAG: 50S ribosomal protein L23 [Candidatus Thorarchaeota archaeon]
MEKFYRIIKRPLITEKTFELIERENKLVFIVDKSANKGQIKRAIEKIHNIKVIKVNTMIRPNGEKKAFIKLHPDFSAQDIAIDLGIF